MEYRLLGPLEVLEHGERRLIPPGYGRALLTLFLLNPNRTLSRDEIIERLWGDSPPASGVKALAFHVLRLRDALDPGRRRGEVGSPIETTPEGYRLRVDPDAIDAVRCERLARSAHALLPTDPRAARDQLVQALELWHGEPLADVAYATFAQVEIRRLEELRLKVIGDRIEAELALGQPASVLGELESLVELHPLDERLRGQLMLALYRTGRQAEALRVFNDGRRLLAEELGIDPSPELTQLETAILAQDPKLELSPAAHGAPRNPYKALAAFSEADQRDFYGREDLVERLLLRLAEARSSGGLLLVTGPSGSGKSSVVRAGLLPAVRQGRIEELAGWRVITMIPGTDPVAELAAAARQSGVSISPRLVRRCRTSGSPASLVAALCRGERGLVLVIDQFEQIFANLDPSASQRFLDGLAEGAGARGEGVLLVTVLRADYLGHLLQTARLARLVQDRITLVEPMTGDELERAVVRPAASVGVTIEPALVARLVSDVGTRHGVLPLLEYTLTRLFERTSGSGLTSADYVALGGVVGGLAAEAERAWAGLAAPEQELARQVFLRLTAVGEQRGDIGLRVPRSTLASLAPGAARLDRILDEFGSRRILVFDRDAATGSPTVEMGHEALLQHWPRLARWLRDARHDLLVDRRLAASAMEWQEAGQGRDYLARGERLAEFEAWASRTSLRLTADERAFLEASAAQRLREEEASKARTAHEQRVEQERRRRGRLLGAMLGAASIIAAVSVFAVAMERGATAERADAARADELAKASVASLGRDRQLTLLLALQAASATAGRGYVTEATYDALQWAVQDAQLAYDVGDARLAVRTAPDGLRGVFLVGPAQLWEMTASRTHRSLTPQECGAYLHEQPCEAIGGPPDGLAGILVGGQVVEPAELADPALAGTRVEVAVELPDELAATIGALEPPSGVDITTAALEDRSVASSVARGEIPDIAIVAAAGDARSLALDGWLLPLDGLVPTAPPLEAAGSYGAGLFRVGAADGGSGTGDMTFAAPIAVTAEDLLWYVPGALLAKGDSPPVTWDEVLTLSEQLAQDGLTPWCIGAEAGSQTGAAAARWIEALFLARHGLDEYDRWGAGEVGFVSTEVRTAFTDFGSVALRPGYVVGGSGSIERNPEAIAAWPLFEEAGAPARCFLYRGGTRDEATFPRLRDRGAAAVVFPATGAPQPAGPVLGRMYAVVAFRDRPEVRAVLQWLLSRDFAAEAAAPFADHGLGMLLAGDPGEATGVMQHQALRLRAALAGGTFRIGLSDLLPAPVATAFRLGTLRYLQFGEGELDDVLWPIDDARARSSPAGPSG